MAFALFRRFRDPNVPCGDPLHTRLAAQTSEVSETSEVSRQLAEVEAPVDEAAAELWGLTDGELREIRQSLAELE